MGRKPKTATAKQVKPTAKPESKPQELKADNQDQMLRQAETSLKFWQTTLSNCWGMPEAEKVAKESIEKRKDEIKSIIS